MARDFAASSSQFLASIDAEIKRLQHLRGQVAAAVDADQAFAKPVKTARSGMSVEGRRRIAEAQKARWAKQKKAITKSVVKKTAGKKAVAQRSAPKKRLAKVTVAE